MISFNDLLIYIVSFFGLYTTIFYLMILYENYDKVRTEKKPYYTPNVSIIVPCYNEESTVTRTIESLLALDYPKRKLEIIAVDDGSTDNTYQKILPFKKKGVKIFRKENGGKHTALNLALSKSKAEFIGALDADSTVEPDALRKIILRFHHKEIKAVTPSMKISKPKGVLRRVQAVEFMIGIFLRRVFADLGSQHVTPGPFTIYRKEFFDKYGNYKSAHNTEDIEVALRIQSLHFQIENATDAYVYTHGPKSFRSLYKQRLRWYYGFLSNVWDYKRLLSKEHGNLGLFVLPSALLSIILVIFSAGYVTWRITSTMLRKTLYYVAINFDIWKLLKPNFDIFFFNTSPVFIISFIGLLVGLLMFLISRSLSQDKEGWWLSYLFFFFLYWILFAIWWFTAGIYKLLGKSIEWHDKSRYEKMV